VLQLSNNLNITMENNTQKGQVSRLLLVLAIVVLVAAIITFLIIRMAEKPTQTNLEPETTIPQPFYQQTLENITFTFQNAIDMGNTLKASETIAQTSWQKDIATTEKFIKVTIGAQNIGKENIEERSWDLGDIIDSEGRKFVPLEGYDIAAWLPDPNLCGTLLKPAFDPTPCTKIYEVSKSSTGLKIIVKTGEGNEANNLSSDKALESQIDLIIK